MPSPDSPHVIDLAGKLSLLHEYWSPKIVARMNDYELKLVKLHGDFTWHDHAETDEVFLIVEGRMEIELRDRTVALRKGELFIVPRGVEHRPRATEECHVLLIEPAGTVNTGTAGGSLTAAGDEWI